MANKMKSRYDILADELVYKFKEKDSTGTVVLKNPKWTPHNIKSLFICSEGCLVEYYTGNSRVIEFKNYTEDEKSKPVASVLYSLSGVSANFTNLRDLVIISGGDLPLNGALDMKQLQDRYSSAYIGLYVIVAETADSTLSDLKALYSQACNSVEAYADKLVKSSKSFAFNLGLDAETGIWSEVSGSRKPDGKPYELSFAGGFVKNNTSGSKVDLKEALIKNGVLSYGLTASSLVASVKGFYRVGQCTFMQQKFHTNIADYPADSYLKSYVSSNYLCFYLLMSIILTKSASSVSPLDKESERLMKSAETLLQLCSQSKYFYSCFSAALHYLGGSELAGSYHERLTDHVAWALHMACGSDAYTNYARILKLPEEPEAISSERYRTFAVQCLARCAMIVAMCLEFKHLVSDVGTRSQPLDAPLVILYSTVKFGGKKAHICHVDGISTIVCKACTAVFATNDYSWWVSTATEVLGVLWLSTFDTTVVSSDMLAEHGDLIKLIKEM